MYVNLVSVYLKSLTFSSHPTDCTEKKCELASLHSWSKLHCVYPTYQKRNMVASLNPLVTVNCKWMNNFLEFACIECLYTWFI